MPLSSKLVLAATLFAVAPVWVQGTAGAATCKELTTARPHLGVPYRGRVSIEDYRFTARIPDGLTGWGGVDSSAPFHGFTIFLDASRRSCIHFEVHLRVDDADAPSRPPDATTMSLGKANAWQTTSSTGSKSGSLKNVKTSFSFENHGDTDDGEIVLVAPVTDLKRWKPLYDTFVKSVRFGVE